MTKLRVLTGEHAGASLKLSQARMRVGPSEDLDVYIGDWNVQQIDLQQDEAGALVAHWAATDDAIVLEGQTPDGDGYQCVLEPLVPMRFGAVILCIGPDESAWPDDVQLLERCFAPPPTAKPERPPVRLAALGPVLLTFMAAAAVLTSSAMVPRSPATESPVASGNAANESAPVSQVSPASPVAGRQPPPAAPDLVQQVRDGLAPELLKSIEVVAASGRVVVRGVLASRSAVDEVHRQLDQLPAGLTVSRRLLSESEIVERLQESLPVSGLQVSRTGPSRFKLFGTVDDLARATRAVQPVAADLGEFGLQIHVELEQRRAAVSAMNGMLIDGQGTSFVRTRDGVKHIVSATRAATASGAPQGPLHPPTHIAPPAQEIHHATR